MGLSFNFEGPETKKLREADMQERELRTKMLRMAVEKEDPATRGAAIDASLQVLQDPNSTTGQKAAAYTRAGELGGTRQVEGIGAVPTVIPEEQVNDVMTRRTQMGAQRLASINQQIDQADQAGDKYGADALRSMRDIQFKNAKENFKKLPIKQAEDLVEFKNLVQLGSKALETTSESLYGPVSGRIEAGKSYLGMSPDFTTMNQAYAGVRNQILKARAGAAVTPSEAERFLQEIGDPYTGDYKQRLESFSSQRRKEYLDKLQAYQEAGFDIPQSLQIGVGSEAGTVQTGQASKGATGVVGKYTTDPATGKVIRVK
jgi:hypothetical protein